MSDSEDSTDSRSTIPDYGPGPRNHEQAPPHLFTYLCSRSLLPGSFLPVTEVFPAEEQPMPATDLPTHHTRGYEEPSTMMGDVMQRRYEHLASCRPCVVALLQLTQQTHTLLIAVTARMSHARPQARHHREMQLPSPVHETEMLRLFNPLRKRPRRYYSWSQYTSSGKKTRSADGGRMGRCVVITGSGTWDDLVGAIQEIAPTTLEGVNQRVTELATTVDQEDDIIYSQLDDARHDRALLRARVNMLYRDRPFHRRTALLMDEEARLSRAAWAQSMDACDQTRSEGISLRTTVMAQQSEITELQAADRRRQTMTELQRQQGPAKDPAEPELPEEAGSST
ncbi:hypothetical protein Tco_1384024 [Tanacetum coccineum]